MKRAILFVVSLSVLGVPCHAVGGAAPKIRAGVAEVDITPKEFPINMPGLFTARPVEKVHDPLHARAIVFDNGTTTLAMVLVDNLHVPRELIDEAKGIASQQCGIAVDKMLVSSTHTHTGGTANIKGRPPEVAYRKVLLAGIAESIVRAHAALRPASVGAAASPLPEEVFCRRWYLKPGKMPLNPFGAMDQVKMNPSNSPDVLDRPAGPTDPDITILSVHDAKTRRPLAVWANYSLHYVGNTPEGMISADYFGEFARIMKSHAGVDKDFLAMMTNGTSGDVNNIPFLANRPPRKPFEQIEIVAQKAADTAWRAHGTIRVHREDARLGMIQREVTLKTRRPTSEQIAAAKAVLAVKDQDELDKLPRLAIDYARRTLSMATSPETVNVQLQALQIGDLDRKSTRLNSSHRT